jgi:benzoyl-CoA-dihydrodiol lyase
VAEGVKGKRALQWGLVDRIAPLSRWSEAVAEMARELAGEVSAREGPGVKLSPLAKERGAAAIRYRYVALELDPAARTARLTLTLPAGGGPKSADEAHAAGAAWWLFELFRELEDALLELRMNLPRIGIATVRVVGDPEVAFAADRILAAGGHWFVEAVRHFIKRVLKKVENSAKSFYAIQDEGTAFAGTFLELALACDRTYLLCDPERPVHLGIGVVHAGTYPMANGLTRLQTRFLGAPASEAKVLEHAGSLVDAATADELGLATFAPDGIDWDDEVRMALEERASFSPDALTGMESNLRAGGPETLETKIFGRLSAWQNWIFQRPNAVGEKGALKCYGTPQRPELDFDRT